MTENIYTSVYYETKNRAINHATQRSYQSIKVKQKG